MDGTRDPREHLTWVVWARMEGESTWVAPAATYLESDAWNWAQAAVDAQQDAHGGHWEFTVRHLADGPPRDPL